MAEVKQEPEKRNVSLYIWLITVTVLFLATFGLKGLISTIAYCIIFMLSFGYVLWMNNSKRSQTILLSSDSSIYDHEEAHCGIPDVFQKIDSAPCSYKCDKRLTGSSSIDEALQEVIEYFFRDYIYDWYQSVSDNGLMPYQLRLILQNIIVQFSNRSKEVKWVPFLTTRLVDVFAMHIRIFRLTENQLALASVENPGSVSLDESKVQSMLDMYEQFFQVECEVEKGISHQEICLDDEKEREYLQDLSEVILYLLMGPEDFHNKVMRKFLKEVIASSVLLPTVNMLCDPDYINQTISWLCTKESTFTIETFLLAIKTCDDVDDLEETRKKIDQEISRLRGQDSESLASTESERAIKKQLSSLMYLRKLCVSLARQLKTGDKEFSLPNEADNDNNLVDLLGVQFVPKLPLKMILEDNTALSYFIEFMGGHNSEHYIFFHLTVEGFRVTAEQQLSLLAEQTLRKPDKGPFQPIEKDLEQLKQAAANIYEEYLSPRASPRIVLEDQLVRKIVRDIKSSEPSGAYFDSAQMQAYKILESPKYYGTFINSTTYVKCLMDMDLIKDKSAMCYRDREKSDLLEYGIQFLSKTAIVIVGDDDNMDPSEADTASTNGSESDLRHEYKPDDDFNTGPLWTPDVDIRFSAVITQAGVCKENGKSYGVYSVHVCRTNSEGSSSWTVCRRYSDFHDLHMQLREKFLLLSWLSLPGKKAFGNMDKNFIEKRRALLEDYLQVAMDLLLALYEAVFEYRIYTILSVQLLGENPGMFELLSGFLEVGEYYKGKGLISRKMDHIVSPIKNSVHSVSHAIKQKSESSRLSSDFSDPGRSSPRLPHKLEQEPLGVKLSELLENEVEDNIPLRILLLLMDEIFDLKHRNQWLRRRIVVILRQIIKATFGDTINRKIVDYVDQSTSAAQIANYAKLFRDSYWPGGVLAETAPPRTDDVRRRMRMVARATTLGSIPDDLKRFLGSEVTREGVNRLFNLLQHVNLNKRLFYCMLEAFLETLFPENKFKEIFTKMHSKKSR